MTTIVTGNCGGGALDVAKLLDAVDAHGAGTNVIHLIPHGAVRAAVMGNADRAPTANELERMKAAGRTGHAGRRVGHVHRPDLPAQAAIAETPELIALAKVVARHGGFYASHIRDEGAGLLGRSTRP